MGNTKVTEDYLESKFYEKCKTAVKGRRVLVCCDTTDYNLDNHKNRIRNFDGLGWMGDNTKIGFIQQGLLAIDRADKKTCLGWAGNYFFKRDSQIKNPREFRHKTKIEGKESYKWLGPSKSARRLSLEGSSHSLFVMDREADIFEIMALLPKEDNTDVLIRCQQNRRLKTAEGESVLLYDHLASIPIRWTVGLHIGGDNRKRRKRDAVLDIRYGKYNIKVSNHIVNKEEYPDEIGMHAIQIKERKSSVPKGEKPINWILWTSETVNSLEEALELLECYRARWYIEEAFRLLKTEGFKIEASELESGWGIRKLLLIAMDASVRIMQLKAVRDGGSNEKMEMYFDPEEIEFIRGINGSLEGATEKLRNPHHETSLSYASWVIARLGGWKGYVSQRPPGTITFKKGMQRFSIAYIGYKLRK